MIILELNKKRDFIEGDVVHLKIKEFYHRSKGRWVLIAEEVTPLPFAMPIGYACYICGIANPLQDANSDASNTSG